MGPDANPAAPAASDPQAQRAEFNAAFAPGMVSPGNIDLTKRPRVRNPDGSISTVRSMSVNFGGPEVLIPTVSDDGRIMSDAEAIQAYKATGKHLGTFKSPADATAYAKRLHDQQAQMYGDR